MKNPTNRRPQPHEFGAYYQGYIDQIESSQFYEALANAKLTTVEFLSDLPEEKWGYRYAPGKWSIKEVIQHVIDAERVFAYRAMRIARHDQTPLPGFDQNDYVEASHAESRSPASLIAEYEAVRASSMCLFESLTAKDLNQIGQMSGFPASALALAFIIAGHEKHHIEILKERYLP